MFPPPKYHIFFFFFTKSTYHKENWDKSCNPPQKIEKNNCGKRKPYAHYTVFYFIYRYDERKRTLEEKDHSIWDLESEIAALQGKITVIQAEFVRIREWTEVENTVCLRSLGPFLLVTYSSGNACPPELQDKEDNNPTSLETNLRTLINILED